MLLPQGNSPPNSPPNMFADDFMLVGSEAITGPKPTPATTINPMSNTLTNFISNIK